MSDNTSSVAAVIPAAGRGRRLGAKIPKAFVPLAGRPLLVRTLTHLNKCHSFDEIIVACDASEITKTSQLLKKYGLKKVKIVAGGATRAESVHNGVMAVSPICQWVLIHDAARPFITKKLIGSLLKEAKKTGAVICARPATATVKRVNLKRSEVAATENREELFLAQTPQVFRKNLLLSRYRTLGKRAFSCTDEAALFDGAATGVRVVVGPETNIKITTPGDIALSEFILRTYTP